MAKIMLVEDDNNLREIYEARLLAEGYEIVTARDGEEALAVAVKERPDLVISDVMMPKISGFDMLDILRSTPETKDVKVIMMTALSQAEDKERASKLGADRYLVKSQVTLEDVAKVAREVLEGTPAGGASQTPVATATPASDTPVISPAPVAVEPVAPSVVTASVQSMPVSAAAQPPVVADPMPTEPIVAAPTPTVEPVAVQAPVVTATPVAAPVSEPVVTTAQPAPAAATVPTPITITVPEEAEPAVDVEALATSTVADTAPVAFGITDLDTSAAEPLPTPTKTEMPDIERPSAEVWAVPAEDTPIEPTAEEPASAVADAEANVQASPAQSLAEEEAAIAQQIENIIDAAPVTDTAQVVEESSATPEVPAPAVEVSTMPELPEPTEPKPATAGQRVIQPLGDSDQDPKPNIHELAAKEAETEANAAPHPIGAVIEPQATADGGVDPNSLAL